MARPRYPFARPLLPAPSEWMELLQPAYDARWFSNGGPVGRLLEAELAERIGGGREVGLVSSATAGITAALIALGVTGSVAVPAFTFPATIHAIEGAGCTPVLCDVDPATWELDPASARAAVELHGCSAIVHVRAFGMCRDARPLTDLARELGVPMVIDAAAAFGGIDPTGAPVGRSGDVEVFSFHATKVFGIGEGGAVAADPELVTAIRHASNFAIDGSDVTGRGLNAKLAEPAAAIGRAMLRRLDAHVDVRAHAVAELTRVTRRHEVRTPDLGAGRPPWQCLPMELPASIDRSVVLDALDEAGIEGRAYYCPGLHRSTAWSAYAPSELPATDAVAARSLCMPLYSDLSRAELSWFAGALDAALSAGTQRTVTRLAA